MIRDKYIALAYRVAALIWTWFGIKDLTLRSAMYYTNMSNYLAFAIFAVLVAKTALDLKNGRHGNAGYFPVIGLIAAIDLLLTLVGFWALLAPISAMSDDFTYGFMNMTLHTYVPLLCFVDFLLFSGNKSLKYKQIYWVLLFPLAYVAFVSVAGLLGKTYESPSEPGIVRRFPYFFIDYDQVGIGVLGYVAGLSLFFIVLAHGLYLFDSKVDKEGIFRRKK
ncbi:MAG: Pr6Pr family membrane protein [Clostridiales bacterium]|jgi:hypothetical protein|nr:Pr6Pr family membrane protein [Clostridiales bacterium]